MKVTSPPSTVARHSSWVGGNISAFHEPGPTAHPNRASSSAPLEPVVARGLLVVVPGRQVGHAGHRTGDDRPVAHHRAPRVVPEVP